MLKFYFKQYEYSQRPYYIIINITPGKIAILLYSHQMNIIILSKLILKLNINVFQFDDLSHYDFSFYLFDT